jgi:hypothetical protein
MEGAIRKPNVGTSAMIVAAAITFILIFSLVDIITIQKSVDGFYEKRLRIEEL